MMKRNLNTSYRLVWNEVLGAFVVVSELAKAKGKRIGRPHMTTDQIPTTFLRHYPAYKERQLNISEFARVCNLSRTTVYKYIDLLENG